MKNLKVEKLIQHLDAKNTSEIKRIILEEPLISSEVKLIASEKKYKTYFNVLFNEGLKLNEQSGVVVLVYMNTPGVKNEYLRDLFLKNMFSEENKTCNKVGSSSKMLFISLSSLSHIYSNRKVRDEMRKNGTTSISKVAEVIKNIKEEDKKEVYIMKSLEVLFRLIPNVRLEKTDALDAKSLAIYRNFLIESEINKALEIVKPDLNAGGGKFVEKSMFKL